MTDRRHPVLSYTRTRNPENMLQKPLYHIYSVVTTVWDMVNRIGTAARAVVVPSSGFPAAAEWFVGGMRIFGLRSAVQLAGESQMCQVGGQTVRAARTGLRFGSTASQDTSLGWSGFQHHYTDCNARWDIDQLTFKNSRSRRPLPNSWSPSTHNSQNRGTLPRYRKGTCK